jgi:hypothetical protein
LNALRGCCHPSTAQGHVAVNLTTDSQRSRGTATDLPTTTTPHVTNGEVRSVAVAGDTVVLGGGFTALTDPDGTVVNRSHLLAYDKATGRIRRDWAPQLDSEVFKVVAAPDGQSCSG